MSLKRSQGSGLGGAGDSGGALGSFYSHTIDQSLRIDGSAYLSKTWGSAADSNQIFTFSAWIKKVTQGDGSSSTDFSIISSVNAGSGTGQGYTLLGFYRDDELFYYTENGGYNGRTKRILRDYSSWMHLCWQYDTTQSTENDRLKFYINGEHIVTNTDNWTNAGHNLYPGLNSVMSSMNQNGRLNEIGDDASGTHSSSSFYIAEVIMLDGVTQAASAFGETKDGVWIPKAYSGSFGANGYHLDFADSSAIGNDVSGNNNDWTANSLAASDVVLDSPTNNFATLNPLYASASQAVLSEGNLKAATAGFSSAAFGYGATSTFAVPKDKKIYIEVECTDTTGDNWFAGFATKTSIETGVGGSIGSSGAINVYNRSVYVNGSENDYGSSAGLGGLGVAKLVAGDILGLMCDGATGEVWASRNGTYFKSPTTDNSGTTGNPAGGTHELGTLTGGTTDDIFFVLGGGTAADHICVNFGQDSVNVASANADGEGIGTFEYAPPTDFLALCSSNLSDPAIGPTAATQADENFNTVLWTGDNSAPRSITGVGFSPDWMWVKDRVGANNNVLVDTVRGISNLLYSNATTADVTSATQISAVGADGFTIGATTYMNENGSSNAYVAWNWLAGTAFSNDASATGVGTIDSEGEVNATAGFAIIKYTGTRSSDAGETGTPTTIAHGLGKKPAMVITKRRDDTSNWNVWHQGYQPDVTYLNYQLKLDTNDASNNAGWQRTDSGFSTTVFCPARHSYDDVSTATYVAYVFAPIEGYSAFGSFVGNGGDQFVYTGFRPAFVLWKRASNSSGWNIADNTRDTDNEVNAVLHPNTTASESTASQDILFVSNGFVEDGYANDSGETVVYAAFAEAPFKYANAR